VEKAHCILPPSVQKREGKYPVGPIVLGFFLFVVIGSGKELGSCLFLLTVLECSWSTSRTPLGTAECGFICTELPLHEKIQIFMVASIGFTRKQHGRRICRPKIALLVEASIYYKFLLVFRRNV
jgi:hypothetical protein